MKHAICFSLFLAALTATVPAHAQPGGGNANNDALSTPGAASGQWLVYKADPQRTSAVPVRVGSVTPNLIWRHSTELTPRTLDTSPLVIGPAGQRRIYFALDREVFCLDGETGQQLWRSKPLSASISSPIAMLPGEGGDLIIAATNNGELNALRTNDGGIAWQGVPDKDKTVSVLNSAPFFVKTPAGDRIILAIGTGRLVAFDLQGRLDPNWVVVLGSFASAPTATATLSRDGSLIYVPTQDKRVWVVNVATARVEYSITTRSAVFASPVVTDDHLIIVTGTTLNGLQLRTGREDWVFDVKSDLGAPAAYKNADGSTTIFIGARNGRFYAIDEATGRVLWSSDLADSIIGAPTVAEDVAFIGTRNGVLFGLAPADGKVLWRYRLATERVITQPSRNRGRFNNNTPGGFGAPGANPGFNAPAQMNPGFAAPRAGGFGGRRGRNDNNQPLWDSLPTITYGVSSPPVILDNQVYVLADNAALYAFSSQPFDAEPPLLFNPQISILNTEEKPSLQRLDGDKGWLGPGRGPVEFVAEINDVGSGVDPSSIRVSLNKQELPASAIASFSDITGKLLVKLTDDKVPAMANLEDGNQSIIVTARDYRGNEMTYSVTFMVDNTAPVPAPTPIRRNDNNNFNNF